MRQEQSEQTAIPPGDLLRLFDELKIGGGKKDALTAFIAPLVNYVSIDPWRYSCGPARSALSWARASASGLASVIW
jgi:hypothetical protein